jgi:hypothetical protein
MHTIHEIANRLTELLREQKFVQAYQELFADEAESIDPIYASEPPLKGLTNLVEREKKFLSHATVHKINISNPLVSTSYFTIILSMDFTSTERGNQVITEICVYKVADGKIVSQHFFIG